MSWWQRGVIYQVYPRSFQDSNGDGVGDLHGIIGRLDYLGVARRRRDLALADLPLADGGLRLRRLRPQRRSIRCSARSPTSTRWSRAAHARGLRVILDYVPNHTSDQHPWFRRAAAATTRARLVHLARSGAGRRPPNNWLSVFGGTGVDVRRPTRPVLLPRLPARAARPRTGATPRCARRCSTCCASGSTAASTASASTRCGRCSRTPQLRDNPPNPDYARRAAGSTTRCCRSTRADQPEVHDGRRRMRRGRSTDARTA